MYQPESSRSSITLDRLPERLVAGRAAWWAYVLDDAVSWPVPNLIFGNGTNIDRRIESPVWSLLLGDRYYSDLRVDKTTKTLELDILGHFDLFGGVGVIAFVTALYLYPFLAIRLPFFRIYLLSLIVVSMSGGHVLNNPQTSTLFVASIVFLQYYGRFLVPDGIKPGPAAGAYRGSLLDVGGVAARGAGLPGAPAS